MFIFRGLFFLGGFSHGLLLSIFPLFLLLFLFFWIALLGFLNPFILPFPYRIVVWDLLMLLHGVFSVHRVLQRLMV